MLRWILMFVSLGGLMGCAGGGAVTRGDILITGDSILAWNKGRAGRVIEAQLGRDVVDRSRSGARVSGAAGFGFIPDIASQYRGGAFNWAVLDGGGNDLLGECGCAGCESTLDALIAPDGQSGEIAAIAARMRGGGARVLLVGYYPVSDLGGPFEPCKEELAELEQRMERLAAAREEVEFTSLGAVITGSDLQYYGPDKVHPTLEASDLIGRHLAGVIAAAGAAE